MFRHRLAHKPMPVPSASFMHVTTPTTADIVVAQGFFKKRFHFPGMVRLANGSLLVVARRGIEHVDRHGKIQLIRSEDEGQTWSRPKTIANSRGDNRDPKISVASSGRVFVSFFTRKDEDSRGSVEEAAYVMHSDDNGLTWSVPRKIETTQSGWAACHGAITEMPDGSLLAPVYQRGRSLVVRSTDGGLTFPASNELEFDTKGTYTNEVTLIRHSSGMVVAWLRAWTDGGKSLVYRSFDSGYTWQGPEECELRQSSAEALELDDGSIMLVWGDLSQRFGERRVTCASVVSNPELPWQPSPPTPLWDAFNYDQGNPALAKMPDGRVMMVVNDYASRQLVAKFITPSALADRIPDDEQLHGSISLQDMLDDGSAKLTTDLGQVWADGPAAAHDVVQHKLGLTPNLSGGPEQHTAHVTIHFSKPQRVAEVGVALRPGENQSATISVAGTNGVWARTGTLHHAWRYGDVDWFPVELESITAIRVVTRVSKAPRPPKSRAPLPAAITHLAIRRSGLSVRH